MERFYLTVVAQGSQSIWVALLVLTLLCMTVIGALFMVYTKYRLLMAGLREASKPNEQRPEIGEPW